MNYDYEKESTQEACWTEFAGEFKKNCIARGINFYFTTGETKAAFAERTKQSIKKFFLPVTWKTLGTSTSTSYRSLSQL